MHGNHIMNSSQGSNTTYTVSGETTEWEDILIKHDIKTKEEVLELKGLNPKDFEKKPEPVVVKLTEEQVFNTLTLNEIDELEEEENFSDTAILDKYRQKRLDELREKALKSKFGDLVDIVKDEWIKEVTESSQSVAVVVHLYISSAIECDILDDALRSLAKNFKYVKFLRVQGSQAVENWPDRNCPALFIYQGGSMKQQMIGLKKVVFCMLHSYFNHALYISY